MRSFVSKAFYRSGVPPTLVQRWSNSPGEKDSIGHLYKEQIPNLQQQQQQQQQQQVRKLEVWVTTCIVTNFGKKALMHHQDQGHCEQEQDQRQQPSLVSSSLPSSYDYHMLINPANPYLTGTRNFPYFPKGGPVPLQHQVPSMGSVHRDWQPLGYVSTWGGMEVGSGMLYPISVVDGLVHQLGGRQLELACAWHRRRSKQLRHQQPSQQQQQQHQSHQPCPIGTAIVTTKADHRLLQEYDAIIHTTPPFYTHDVNPHDGLKQCYQSSLALANVHEPVQSSGLVSIVHRLNPWYRHHNNTIITHQHVRVAVPLLGAGARGFPSLDAMHIAGQASVEWLHGTNHYNPPEQRNGPMQITLAFGLLEKDLANELVQGIEMFQSTT